MKNENISTVLKAENGPVSLLEEARISVTEEMCDRLDAYVRLLREWNSFASLVSEGDLAVVESVHVPDSLSLAPLIMDICGKLGRLLDIGSGGGFPAIPLKIVLPGLRVDLVERGTKKVGFLEKVVGALELEDVRVVQGQFPEVELARPDVITARAVEKPRWLLPRVAKFMEVGSVFLCQTGNPELDERFHVEHVEDRWKDLGFRRGDIYVVRRVG